MIDRTGTRIDRRIPEEIDGRGAVEPGDPDLRHNIDFKTPEGFTDDNVATARRTDGTAHRDHRPRGRRGHGHRDHYHNHNHYYGCGHYGYGYDPFYFGFGFHSPIRGFGFYSGYGGYYYAPEIHVSVGGGGGGGGQRDAAMGALDLDLRPSKAEVFVDGSYVGVADQFDGFPTYLWLEEGTYEIAFYREGYETIFRQYTIYPGVIIDVDDRMRRGESVLPAEPLPLPSESSAPGPVPGLGGELGRIAVEASPADAAVYLDGHFVGTAAQISELAAGLIVEPGEHVVEVIRPGYSTESATLSVQAGQQASVQLELDARLE